MKSAKYFFACAAAVAAAHVSAQESRNEWQDPGIPAVNKAAPRVEFVSYDIRDDAVSGNLEDAHYFRSLTDKLESPPADPGSPRKTYITLVSLSYMWLDRESFLHVEGLPAFYAYMNDAFVGYAEDSHAPSEFNVSKFVKEGVNTVRIEVRADGTGAELESALPGQKPKTTPTAVYLYSQPKLRIDDFKLSVRRDSVLKRVPIEVNIAVSSTYNHPEPMTVGYDIYNPQGKLMYYDMRDITIAGHGRDTVRMTEIFGGPVLWSAENPQLYKMMFFVRRSGRATEYIPYRMGFGETDLRDGKIYRNNVPVSIRAVSYNAAPAPQQTEADLKDFKARDLNTIYVDYPQPEWFYDLCDQVGMYVVDQVNLNSAHQPDNRIIGGTYSNDPAWLDAFLDRTRSTFARNRDRTCIIAWSLGGQIGNGYNLYKTYRLLKSLDPHRAVVYRHADGEWNSDVELPSAVSGAQILRDAQAARDAVAAKPAARRR